MALPLHLGRLGPRYWSYEGNQSSDTESPDICFDSWTDGVYLRAPDKTHFLYLGTSPDTEWQTDSLTRQTRTWHYWKGTRALARKLKILAATDAMNVDSPVGLSLTAAGANK